MTIEVFDEFASLERQKIIVPIMGVRYLLMEADTNAAKLFKNACARAGRMVDGEIVGVDNIGEVEPLLVGMCLYQLIPAKPGFPTITAQDEMLGPQVDRKVMAEWPSRIVKRLFDRVKEMSDLNETETEEQISKSIEKLQKKLDKLRKAKAGSVAKNEPANTGENSD